MIGTYSEPVTRKNSLMLDRVECLWKLWVVTGNGLDGPCMCDAVHIRSSNKSYTDTPDSHGANSAVAMCLANAFQYQHMMSNTIEHGLRSVISCTRNEHA